LVCLFVVVNTVFNFAATTLRGVGKLVFEAILQGVGAVVFVAAGALALALDAGVVPLLAIMAGKEAISATVALVALRRAVGAPRRPSRGLWRRLLRIGLQLALATAALATVTRIPTLVLGGVGTSSELAWYSGAQRLADAILLLAITCGFAVLPSLTLLFESEPARAWTFLRNLLAGAVAAGALVGAIGLIFADTIVTIAFGSDFESAAAAARALMAGAPAYAITGIAWYGLVALGRERSLLAVAGVAAVASLALSLILIPGEGDVGAGIAVSGAAWLLAGGLFAVLIGARRSSPRGRVAP
jgi:O-antigen/teichoic acid export membrane protein